MVRRVLYKNRAYHSWKILYTIFNYKVPKVYKLHLFAIVLNLIAHLQHWSKRGVVILGYAGKQATYGSVLQMCD